MGGASLAPGLLLSTKVTYALVGKVIGGEGAGEGKGLGEFGPDCLFVSRNHGGAGPVATGNLSAVAEAPTFRKLLPIIDANSKGIGGFKVTVMALFTPPLSEEKLTPMLLEGIDIPLGLYRSAKLR